MAYLPREGSAEGGLALASSSTPASRFRPETTSILVQQVVGLGCEPNSVEPTGIPHFKQRGDNKAFVWEGIQEDEN